MTAEQAFKLLRKQLNDAISQVRRDNQELINRNRFGEAQRLAEKGEILQSMKADLSKLQRKWGQTFPQEEMLPGIVEETVVQRGLKTPQEAFYTPILQALVEMNGRGKTAKVVDRVGEIMAGILNDFDRERLETDNRLRWRSTTEWARNELKVRGLIKRDSPRGTWEISEAGREYLKQQGSG